MGRPALNVKVAPQDLKYLEELLSGGVQQVRVGQYESGMPFLYQATGEDASTPDGVSERTFRQLRDRPPDGARQKRGVNQVST